MFENKNLVGICFYISFLGNLFLSFYLLRARFSKLLFVRVWFLETPICQWPCTCGCEWLFKFYVDADAHSHVFVYAHMCVSKGIRF